MKVDSVAPVLLESSHGTKIAKEKHPGTYELRKDVSEDGCGVFLAILPELAHAMDALGTPLTAWLFRPGSQPAKGWFLQQPLSTSAIGKRVQVHLQAMGCWEGESAYSFRRGSAQDLSASGMGDNKSIMRLRQWRTEKTLRRYLHTTRHKLRLRPVPARSELAVVMAGRPNVRVCRTREPGRRPGLGGTTAGDVDMWSG